MNLEPLRELGMEYRPSMDNETLRAWAADVSRALAQLDGLERDAASEASKPYLCSTTLYEGVLRLYWPSDVKLTLDKETRSALFPHIVRDAAMSQEVGR